MYSEIVFELIENGLKMSTFLRYEFKYFSSGNCSIRISGSFLKRDYCVAKNSFILRGTGQLKDRFQKNLFVSKKGLGEKQKSGCCHTKVAKNGHSGEVKFS